MTGEDEAVPEVQVISSQNVSEYNMEWTEQLFSISSEEKDVKHNITIFHHDS